MKVLIVSNYDTWGGAARACHRLHKGLLGQGIDSRLAVRRRLSNVSGAQLLAPGIISRVGSIMRGVANRRAIGRYNATAPDWPELFSHTRGRVKADWQKTLAPFDIINLHWVPETFDYGSFFAGLGKQQRVVWTLHDMNPFTGGCHYAADCRKFNESCGACPQLGSTENNDLSSSGFNTKMKAFSLLNDDQLTIVTPSQWLGAMSSQSSLLHRFEHRVIPYGVETDEFKPLNRQEIRAGMGIAENEQVLLMLSLSLEARRKGMDLLQQALESMFNDQPICLLTVGAGDVPDVGIRTINLGKLESDEAVAAAYNAADIFVAPSREDNLPNTVLESLACGTPVVAFNIGGMPDMIDPGETGLLARPEDSRDLGRCIRELFEHPDLAVSMRDRCREVAEDRYTLQRQADDYIMLFNEIH